MKTWKMVAIVCVAIVGVIITTGGKVEAVPRPEDPALCATRDWRVVAGIVQKRDATWDWEQRLDLPRSETSYPERWARSCAYLEFVRGRWASKARRAYDTWRKVQTPEGAIKYVFGEYADEALAVARCESGGSMTPRAVNGQYLGMFQMGDYARSRFGHGETPLEQAEAAYAYFVAAGRDWSPWSCKPW